MFLAATIVLGVLALLLLALALILLTECMAGALPLRAADAPTDTRAEATDAVIVVPAHDEEAGIAATVEHLVEHCGAADRVLVVADNCSDATASRARDAGATVLERQEDLHRGKGYAIFFALEHLDSAPPAVVVLVDADCRLSAGGIEQLVAAAAAQGRPIQAEYVFAAPTKSVVSVISSLATLVRNVVRPRGLLRLGRPTHLVGSGMAFPWPVLRACPPPGSDLVEDLVMGIELALAGHPALHCPAVTVMSDLPSSSEAARGQRRRWEHGQLSTSLRQGPRLIGAGLSRGNLDLLALGLDLIVPPLALFVLEHLALVLGAGLLVWLGGSTWPLYIGGASLLVLGLAVIAGWASHGRATIPGRYLLAVPFYVLWKLPLYAALLFGKRERRWKRTER